MTEVLNHYVDLRADFSRPISLQEAPGEGLANLLADGLRDWGVAVLDIEGPDVAHYIKCRCGNSIFDIMVGVDDFADQQSRWFVQPGAKRSFFGRKTHRDSDLRQLLLAIDKTLQGSDRISDVRWFPYFDGPHYLALLRASSGPIRDPKLDRDPPLLIRLDSLCDGLFGMLASPLGCILGFASFVVLAGFAPRMVGVIALIYFLFLSLVGMIFPLILSHLIYRAAQRTKRIKWQRIT